MTAVNMNLNRIRMNRLRTFWLILILAFTLTSCDNWVFVSYVVKNKSENDVRLFVPNYCPDGYPCSTPKDSILNIKPNEVVMITGARSLYPSAKGFYRNYPGVCGLKRINNDTIIDLGCSRKEWKFRKGSSMLILK